MSFNLKQIAAAALLSTGILLAPYAQANESKSQAQTIEVRAEKHSDVCMVTNNVALMKMIPVEVEGKTYYGCCQGCVGKLKFKRSVRFAVDPVTGKEVDKADAFIVKDENNKAVYFESKETATKFFSNKN
ncbi:MAG: hypothetical protein HYS21_09685 [Deltaproteobacteria bacterium]|nr:hypothetical protein [Deltaproteobacteria bacterium]